MMPRMSGDELVAAVRREPALAHVPILVLSAKADEALRLKLLREGVQDYVVKPFSAEEVVARVRNLVQLERARAELERKNVQLQRLQELELRRQSEAHFRTLAETIPQLVWVTRPDGHAEFFNQHWYEYTGLTPAQSSGGGWAACLNPEDQALTWQVWHRSLETGKTYEIECRLRRAADGEYRWFLGRAVPVRDSEGHIIKWFGTCTDIHDQKQAQVALEQAVQLRDEFLSVAAHELRTPLTAFKLQVELLGRAAVATWGRLPESLEGRVQGMHRQVSRLSALNEALLDVSRLSVGRLHLELEEVELAEAVQETLERLRPELERSRCALEAEVEPGLWGRVDRLRLEQVLTNLLTNAARYGVGKPVQVRLSREQGQAVLSIKDQGIGIRPEDQERIFRRFERAASYHYGGLGLGLYISSRLVEAMDGSIAVDSRLGQGATFTVRLPLCVELPSTVAPG
jgi:PAS domain S-box-containing protein